MENSCGSDTFLDEGEAEDIARILSCTQLDSGNDTHLASCRGAVDKGRLERIKANQMVGTHMTQEAC